MKTLSVKNPWAFLIASGNKDVENRNWRTHYRGKIFIHVSQKPDLEYVQKVDFNIYQSVDPVARMHLLSPKPQWGKIIGEVEILDCIRDSTSKWAQEGCWHWILANPVLYERIKIRESPVVKGKLGLWNLEY